MAGYFDEAFLTLESSPDRTADNELLYDANELLNFAAADNELLHDADELPNSGADSEEEGATGSCHGENYSAVEATFEDADSLDDRDGLYSEGTPNSIRNFSEETGGDANVAVAEDRARSWRISHSSGDHKLQGRLGPVAFYK